MRYAKMLALAAMAAGALMAFIGAGTASANVVCSTNESPCPAGQKWPDHIANVDFSSEGSTRLIDVATGETTDTCKESTLTGTFTQGTTATNPGNPILHATELKWTNCTFPTKTTELGTLELDPIVGGKGNATVTGKNFKVTINTVLFGSCIYGTGENLSLGDLTEGNPAIFHAAVHVPFISGGFACPKTAEWNATYKITSPSNTTGALVSK